jgi:predicted Zn-dependent protease
MDKMDKWKAALALFFAVAMMPLITAERASAQDTDEAQMGAQVYDELKQKGEIVASSPLYDELRPIASAITRVVQPKYQYPIHFYIVHESQPNAFATPGGNIYVVDSLFYFVHNAEELAGTICHETSHLIHHDSVKEMQHNEAIRKREIAAGILLGPSWGTLLATSAIGNLDSLHYSRSQEESADLTGSDTCAAAGVNPWGLVWLFQDFSNANFKTPPEILSDHPDDANRIAALEKHFQQNPETFARFSSNPKTATALKVPKNAPERFVPTGL